MDQDIFRTVILTDSQYKLIGHLGIVVSYRMGPDESRPCL